MRALVLDHAALLMSAQAALDKRVVLTALSKVGDFKFSGDKLHCDFNGDSDIYVRDFFEKYVIWGQTVSPSIVQAAHFDRWC